MKLGTKIKNLRTEKNISQVELAYKLDVAQTTMSNIESGKTIPDFLLMEKISEEFEVGLDYFLSTEKVVNKIKKAKYSNIGCEKGTINVTADVGVIENILKRLDDLEAKH